MCSKGFCSANFQSFSDINLLCDICDKNLNLEIYEQLSIKYQLCKL